MHIQWCGSVYGSLSDRSSITKRDGQNLNTNCRKMIQNMDPFWTKESKVTECESVGSAIIRAAPAVHFIYPSNWFVNASVTSAPTLLYITCDGEPGIAQQQWIKLLQLRRKQFNKPHFLSKRPVKRGWMNGCMYIVPDTGTDNVLSWILLFLLPSNCKFKTAWQP